MADSQFFKDKPLMIAGGTGSFGSTVLRHFLDSDLKEIRIFSRVYISEELTIPHDQSDHLSRRFRSLISERDSLRSKSFL